MLDDMMEISAMKRAFVCKYWIFYLVFFGSIFCIWLWGIISDWRKKRKRKRARERYHA